MELYFAKPGCPYPRGTRENTSGLIHQYFPMGTDFHDISRYEVRQVAKTTQQPPSPCLGFWTPAEGLFEKTPPSGCD
jgi:IS30 family transposase